MNELCLQGQPWERKDQDLSGLESDIYALPPRESCGVGAKTIDRPGWPQNLQVSMVTFAAASH